MKLVDKTNYILKHHRSRMVNVTALHPFNLFSCYNRRHLIEIVSYFSLRMCIYKFYEPK